MYASAATVLIDPLEELMGWIYEQVYEIYIDIFDVVLYGDGLILSFTLNETAMPVADQLRTLVYACYATIIVIGGLFVMTHESLQTRYSMKEILPRLVLGLGLAWFSESLIWIFVDVNHDIVRALLGWDETRTHWAFPEHGPVDGFDAMLSILGVKQTGDFALAAVLQVVLMLVAIAVLAWCVFTRLIAWIGVVMTAPLALACHGLPITENISRLWWRMVGGCLGSSIGQAACVWVWAQLAFTSEGNAVGESDPHVQNDFSLDFLYVLVLIWVMWKVHAVSFTWARGRPVRIPGARMVAGIVAWKTMNRFGAKRSRTQPRRFAGRQRIPGSTPLRTRTAPQPPAVPSRPPSGWNDGWDRDVDRFAGLSPARGWRPRIDQRATARAAQRRGRPATPRITRLTPTLTVHQSSPAAPAPASFERPPRLPNPIRPAAAGRPTPAPSGTPGMPPRHRPAAAPAVPTRGLPASTRAPVSRRAAVPSSYSAAPRRDDDGSRS